MSYVTVIVNDPKNQHKKQVGGQGLLQWECLNEFS
jgi:hypothetical protein